MGYPLGSLPSDVVNIARIAAIVNTRNTKKFLLQPNHVLAIVSA